MSRHRCTRARRHGRLVSEVEPSSGLPGPAARFSAPPSLLLLHQPLLTILLPLRLDFAPFLSRSSRPIYEPVPFPSSNSLPRTSESMRTSYALLERGDFYTRSRFFLRSILYCSALHRRPSIIERCCLNVGSMEKKRKKKGRKTEIRGVNKKDRRRMAGSKC